MPTFKYPSEKWGNPEEVEKMYHTEKDVRLSMRLNVIRLLMQGRPKKEVAEYLGVSVATIGNWRTLWDQGGKEALRPKNKGRRSRVTDDIKADIQQIVEIKRQINGRTVTGYLIHGYLKKNTD
jgi:transposase